MKLKVRRIEVDSSAYIWSVTEIDQHTVKVKVWKDKNKKSPWFIVEKRFDDPWINFKELSSGMMKSDKESLTTVTPSLVSAYIKTVQNMNLDSSEKTPILLKTNGEGGIEFK